MTPTMVVVVAGLVSSAVMQRQALRMILTLLRLMLLLTLKLSGYELLTRFISVARHLFMQLKVVNKAS